MNQPFRGLQVATSLAFTGLLAFVVAMGFFGCQGCQSGEGTDLGSPEKILEGDGRADENPEGEGEGETEGGGHVTPGPVPEADRKEKALVEKIEFIENAMLHIARVARESGRQTTDFLLEEVKAHPEDALYIHLHGELLLSKGEFKEARKLFEKVLAKDPEFWPAWKGIALSWVKEDKEKAREALEHLYSPEVPGPWGLLLIGEFFEVGDKKAEAEEAYGKAKEHFPKSVYPLIKLMQLFGVTEAWEKSFHHSEMALKRAPKNQKVWYFKAQVHLLRAVKARRRDARAFEQHRVLAIQALEECVKIDPKSEIGRGAGDLLRQIKDPFGPLWDTVFDTKAPVRERLRGLARLLQLGAGEQPVENWKRAAELPEKALRLVGIKGLAVHGSEEAVKILAGWLQDPKKPLLDRTEIGGGFRIIRSRDHEAPRKFRSLAVPGLLGGFKACLANFKEKKDEDEAFLFQDILDVLGKWTGKNFGEGRDHADAEEMKKTIAEWEAWWEKQEK